MMSKDVVLALGPDDDDGRNWIDTPAARAALFPWLRRMTTGPDQPENLMGWVFKDTPCAVRREHDDALPF